MFALLLAGAADVQAAQSSGDAAVLALLVRDARLLTIGERLARANAPFCNRFQPSVGLQIADARSYADPARLRTALGLGGDFAIGAVAAGGPADAAGIRAGAEVLAVDGFPLSALPAHAANDTSRIATVQDRIDAALESDGQVRIDMPGSSVTLAGIPVCRARFELATDRDGARAGALMVQVGQSLLAEARGDDEAAFIFAHELAHVVLAHSGSGRHGRAAEREADRLAPWLMANAGYDPVTAVAFLGRWRARGLRILGDGAHDSATVRRRAVAGEIALMASIKPDANGMHDWRSRFPAAH